MAYTPGRHHRRSIRLPGYDYRQPGMYFVTICTQNRECLLGTGDEGAMQLNDAGQMVVQVWTELPNRFPFLLIDEFVTMPNHLHGIIEITERRGESRIRPNVTAERRGESRIRLQIQNVATSKGDHKGRPYNENVPHGTLSGTIGRAVQAFKSLTTYDYIVGVNKRGWTPFPGQLWQVNYYEHVIRNEDDLRRIREYIQTNPVRWELDRENPAKRGEDEFDRWLDSLSRKKGQDKK